MKAFPRDTSRLACAAGVLTSVLCVQILSWAWLLSRPDWVAPWQDAIGAHAVLALFSLLWGLPLGWLLGVPLLRRSRRWGRGRLVGLGAAGAGLGLLGGAGLWCGLLRFSHAGPAVMGALALAGAAGAWTAGVVEARLARRASSSTSSRSSHSGAAGS
ncbi:hypothetical protein AACH06_23865 [Ideonella sp. DXS29W]|uniref:Uncharacterized protein n=1 Tax=Ideonella lacteola TaxID=2984193 RepID=A0ABU9BWS7_9BURK